MSVFLPTPGQALVDPRTGHFTSTYRRWANALTEAVNAAQGGTIIVPPDPVPFVVSGAGSVTADGSVAGGEFVVTLIGDKDNPPPNSFYGATTAGDKGFVPVYDALAEGVGIAIRDSGYIVIDTVETPDDLPLTGNSGEAVRVTGAEPGLYAWDGAAFTLDPAATGAVDVSIDASLDDLNDVDAPSPTNDQLLAFESSSGKWKPKTVASGAGVMQFVGSAQVTGTAATALTIGGLDLASDGMYVVQLCLANATGSAANITLTYNSDTTVSNYSREIITANGATLACSRAADALISGIDASSYSDTDIRISQGFDGKPVARATVCRARTTSFLYQTGGHVWATAANVTGMTFTSTVANALAVGSFVKVWRVLG